MAFTSRLLLWIPQSFLFSFPVLSLSSLCSLPPSPSCCQWVHAVSRAPYLLTTFTFMIPIGNGIQLVWITTLGHDQSTTSALHSSLTLSMSGKLFTRREETRSDKSFSKRDCQKTEHTLLVCIIFTNYIYVFVKGFTSSLVSTWLSIHSTCDTETAHETGTVKLWPCQACFGWV